MEEEKTYIDSPVFVYAALEPGKTGAKARRFIAEIEQGTITGSTSALTFDEAFWKIKKKRDKKTAIDVTGRLLTIPFLEFVDVNVNILWKALEIIKGYGLDPRDAIHAATAISTGREIIISEDKDFDRIKELKRKWL
jgi:predicted nucleic acid-binding protein